MNEEAIRILITKYLAHSASPQEEATLFSYIDDPEYGNLVKELIDACWQQMPAANLLTENESDRLFQNILRENYSSITGKPIRHLQGYKWLAAAAVFAFLLTAAVYFFAAKHDAGVKQLAKVQKTAIEAPKVSLASLSYLPAPDAGGLPTTVSSQSQAVSSAIVVVTNPRASQVYKAALPDGTIVWLNAGSRLEYPRVFTGRNRVVKFTGEGYFEVAHNSAHPFIVKNGQVDIRVLGTHFNVNTYSSGGHVLVTLLEGAVKVSNGSATQLLKPGEQAKVDNVANPGESGDAAPGGIQLIRADTVKAMAWKNDLFNFSETGLLQIMQQLEVWYDIEAVYADGVKAEMKELTLSGTIPRNTDFSSVLELLHISSGLNFRIDDRKVIVSQ